ncbi:MAG: EamA family transporter [Chloroflexia bacterium]|nr:EamA family transporter [Chloroflexia bacterium]
MANLVREREAVRPSGANFGAAIPPHAFFLVSAIFHYLGPALAVLLFAQVNELGVAWLRVATAAAVFALWRRPWRIVGGLPRQSRWTLLALGAVLGAMNVCFYLAIARLPLATVGAIEFLGPIALATLGVRSNRNGLALTLAVAGAWLLTDVRFDGAALGFAFGFANCVLFMLYVVLGHRVARDGGGAIDRLGLAMIVALVSITPIALVDAAPAFTDPRLLLSGIAVGICSSVIPYVCDQLAMARLPRATFALMLALLPACAAAIGLFVLQQYPHRSEVVGIALIVGGVAVHRESELQTP